MEQFQIQDLTFSYPGAQNPCLEDVSFSIGKGEYVLLCGTSGCGKTTLLRHLKSVLTPRGAGSGKILYCGTPLDQVEDARQAQAIGFVMQNPDDQIVTDKVWHELAFGLENLGIDRDVIGARVAEMASFFGIQSWFHRDVSQLSGGQKQLLNLASIMAMQPEILILDEPTGQLDPIAAGDFLNTLKKINRELGTTVLITEHRVEEIFPAADRVLVMEQGKLTVDSPPRQAGRLLIQRGSPLCDMLPAPMRVYFEVEDGPNPPLTVREGRSWLEEQQPFYAAQCLPPEAVPQGKTAVEVKDVWFRYERQSPDVLKGLNMRIPEGSLYAIVGSNGGGKSTTLRMICGICKPYRGSVEVLGKNIQKYPKGSLFHNCLTMLPQDPRNLFVKQTVEEELEEMTHSPDARQKVAAICQIDRLMKAKPYDLSGGEQQRVALAKVLLTNPRVLLLDEPTKGLDCCFKRSFAATLKELTREGMTIIMVSHDIEFCAEYADMAAMFFDGRLIASGTPKSFFGGNSFYTTAASRMSKGVFENAVTARDVAARLRKNRGEGQ